MAEEILHSRAREVVNQLLFLEPRFSLKMTVCWDVMLCSLGRYYPDGGDRKLIRNVGQYLPGCMVKIPILLVA